MSPNGSAQRPSISMKQTFGFLFLFSIFIALMNPIGAPLWGRILLPVLVLVVQAVVVGKGLKKAGELTSELNPTESTPSTVGGSCRWELFEDGSWILRAEMASLSKELAFHEGSTQKFEIVLGGGKIKPRWVRSELSVPDSYRLEASKEGKSPKPKHGDTVEVLRLGESFLTGVLSQA